MRGFACLAALALSVAAVPASAATMVQTDDEFTWIGFDPFDPSLGTLDSVTLQISVWRPRAWLMNVESDEPTSAEVGWAVNGSWMLPASDATNGVDIFVPLTGAGTANVAMDWVEEGRAFGIFGVYGEGGITLTLNNAAFLGDRIFFNGTDHGFFEDVGDTTLSGPLGAGFLHLSSACPTPGGAYDEAEDACGGVNYTLTYNYTPGAAAVPEPGTWAMMLVGFAGVGTALRRSRRRRRLAAA